MNSTKIYFDYAATTPVDSRVLEQMLPYFSQIFGNSSSIHTFGQQSEAALDDAREQVAHALNCLPGEVIFTACGSESDNLALRGSALAAQASRNANTILISPVEHHAVSLTAKQLADLFGFNLIYLPVNRYGIVEPQAILPYLTSDVAVVSIIYANNEIGSINPISEIGALCRERGIILHTDAVQAAAYLPIDTTQLHVDLLSIGAHKFYGPKGVGALYIRKGTSIVPTLTGGGQEFGLRAGTHNIPYIVGLAEALRIANAERNTRVEHLLPLRDRLIGRILEEIPDSQLTGHPQFRMPNHASFVFRGVNGNTLLMLLDTAGFACSSGSACKTGNPEPSDVLLAIGLERDWAMGSLRITLGIGTTPDEIDHFIDQLPKSIQEARTMGR
jgi:cysteine desulfurase